MSSKVEALFSLLDTSTIILRNELDFTYLEALAEACDSLFEGAVLQEELRQPATERLQREYAKFHENQYTSEDIRKAIQLCLLKGMKDGVQATHAMTPDAVGMFMSYLFNKFTAGQTNVTVLDPAIGTGNLLTTVFNHRNENVNMSGFGVEVDELLVRLAFMNANLQKHSIELFHQDGLAPLYIDPVDAIVCDLPVGYYPDEKRAKEYALRKENGLSYAHHLFIEQSTTYTKEGGYLFFLIPNFLFTSEEAPKLHAFLQEHCYIQGVLQLAVSMFKNEKNAKSILILQKKGAHAKPPKQAMLAELPPFSNIKATEHMMSQLNEWFLVNKAYNS